MRFILRNAKFLMVASFLTMLGGLVAFATTSFNIDSPTISPAYFLIIASPSALLFFLVSLPLSLWGDKRRKTMLAAYAQQALLDANAHLLSGAAAQDSQAATQKQAAANSQPAEAMLPEMANPLLISPNKVVTPYQSAQSYAGAFIFLLLALVTSLGYLILQTLEEPGVFLKFIQPWILGAVLPFGLAALISLGAAFYTHWRYGKK
ncbi:hypothetical protein NXS08_05630 [Gleimia sp. 6138-11-ORH1]|uniref:hypothetical protein n=1 Tax=Gleimia sp. 6138-11-ORH1 TaxID=2973937 RepID=UPI0021676726|nr:hypothetical protein [Gleimia sp. 6138-11-ORH1]MCS4484950.1 hypothetical protein [Gleimia sp. 6138-11-ORH1]